MLSEERFEELYGPARITRLERRYKEAIACCTTLLKYELTPRQRVLVLEMRGVCYTGQSELELAETDLTQACQIAEKHNLTLEHVHALTSLVRLRLRQHRHWAAAENVLPRAEQLLRNQTSYEANVLRASIESLYGVLLFRNGRTAKALRRFDTAANILDHYPDPVRYLRNLRRLTYAEAWDGHRREAWHNAGEIIDRAQRLTAGRGDILSVRLGRYIRFCCMLPWPAKWGLWVVKHKAGL